MFVQKAFIQGMSQSKAGERAILYYDIVTPSVLISDCVSIA